MPSWRGQGQLYLHVFIEVGFICVGQMGWEVRDCVCRISDEYRWSLKDFSFSSIGLSLDALER
jgi:hypothetical protein